MQSFRAAVIQSRVGRNRTVNLQNAVKLITQAKTLEPKLVALPEFFNSPCGSLKFAESIPSGPTSEILSKAARENAIYLVGGSIPEVEGNTYYNTCTVWNPEGKLVAKYRKMHLFDVDIAGGMTFKESDLVGAGHELATFDMEGVKVGIGLCYDLRFEELAKLYKLKGVEILIYPAVFGLTTGPMHFELLQRSRALDNQVFVLGVSQARGTQGYVSWGHSQITDPWGKVIAQAKEGEEIIHAEIDLNECAKAGQQIPIFVQRRTDIYDTVRKP